MNDVSVLFSVSVVSDSATVATWCRTRCVAVGLCLGSEKWEGGFLCLYVVIGNKKK